MAGALSHPLCDDVIMMLSAAVQPEALHALHQCVLRLTIRGTLSCRAQAILFQNGRALGRLVSPQLQVTPIAAAQPVPPQRAAADTAAHACGGAVDEEAAGSREGQAPGAEAAACAAASATADGGGGDGGAHCPEDTLLEVHQLVFDRWQPVWTDFKRSRRSVVLHIPVNSAWRTATYRLQVCLAPKFAAAMLLFITVHRLLLGLHSRSSVQGRGNQSVASSDLQGVG